MNVSFKYYKAKKRKIINQFQKDGGKNVSCMYLSCDGKGVGRSGMSHAIPAREMELDSAILPKPCGPHVR